MAKLRRKVSRPSRSWVGRYLTARENTTVPVLSGFNAEIAEVQSGQDLEVIEVQQDGWLKCRLKQDMFFRDDNRKKVHSKDLIVGVHLEHDIDRFHVRRKRLREAADTVGAITATAQLWLNAKRALDDLGQDLVQMATASPEMDRRLEGMVREIRSQRERIDKAWLALQRHSAVSGMPDWFESAVSLLRGLAIDFEQRTRRFEKEIQQYWNQGPCEQNKLVQAFSWITSFARRMWTWLRKSEKKIAELEGLVFYS